MWDDGDIKSRLQVVEPDGRIFVDSAFSSGTHTKFAVRGALSAIACYMFYMSVGWVGLSASVATCILTALPISGAARHKQLTRFTGVALGACAIGFTTQLIVLPQLDSILTYTLLFAAVIFLGALIGTSGPRISYCGVQIVLAYELVNLNRFSLNPSLVPARDTVLGVIAAVGAMWLIFDHLWATSSTESLRSVLSTTIREIAQLSLDSMSLNPAEEEALLEKHTSAITRNFERLRSLVDMSLFEAFPKTASDELLLQQARDYLPQLRIALLIKTGLIHHRIVSGSTCHTEIVVQVQQRCSDLLEEIALNIDNQSVGSSVTRIDTDGQIHERLRSEAELIRKGLLACDLTELRLCTSLFDVVQHLRVAH